MLYLLLVLNRMQSNTSFGGPTPKPVSLTVLLQRLMFVGYVMLLLSLPPPADTTSQFRCLPRTQHFLVYQENLEDGILTPTAGAAAAYLEEASMDLDITHLKV